MILTGTKGIRGNEFVSVGVTRGDPQRDPDKPLNPVSTAGLVHAVMSLDLGLDASTGLGGAQNWTLGDAGFVHPPVNLYCCW